MATMLGSLLVSLGLETGTFKSGLTEAQKQLQRTQRQFQKIGQGMQQFGTNLTVGVTAPLVSLGALAVKGFVEQERAIADVNAALASMGNVAGRTSQQLAAAADAMEMRSLFDAEVILKQVTANLLTFGNIAGEQFDRAQQAAIDMATRLGTEPQSAAIALGKALNDPVKGITSLTRVGVQFTEAQKAQIAAMQAAGNAAGAQGIILAEVERQFAGAAKAAADTTPWRQAEVAIGQAGDKIGAAILPIIPPVTAAIVSMANAFAALPAPMQEGIVIFAAVAAAVGPVLIALGGLVSIAPALATAFGVIKVAALGLMANPVILAFAVVIAGIYLAWQNWDKIEPILRALYEGAKKWILKGLGYILEYIKNPIGAVTNAFKAMYVAVVGNSYVPDMVDEIGQHMNRLQANMVDPATKATQSVTEAARQMASDVSALLDRLFPEIAAARAQMEDLALIDKAGLSDAARAEARRRALGIDGKARVSDDLLNTGPLEKAAEVAGTVFKDLRDKAEIQTVRIAKTFSDMVKDVSSSLQRLTSAVKDGGFFGILDAVIGLGIQLGQTGLFGSKIQANLNKPIPGFAKGTNFAPGGLAIVGERGPELVNLPRGSGVMSNKDLSELGGASVHVIPSPYFDVVVDKRIGRAAPAIAGAGASQALGQMQKMQGRRLA